MGEQSAKDNGVRNGIRLGRFYAVTGAVIVLVGLVLLFSTYLTIGGYSAAEQATERYNAAQRAAADMQSASDYMTSEARAFAATGDPACAAGYFEEKDVTRRRDRALDEIEELLDSPSTYAYLSTALDRSNALAATECYAMRLAAESYGLGDGEIPEQLSRVTLKDSDLRLSPGEQREKALALLFDESYRKSKEEISENVSMSLQVLLEDTRARQTESASRLLLLMHREEVLIILLLALALFLTISTVLLVTRPLKNYVDRIQQGELLEEQGAYELRFLARTYNEAREHSLRDREQLSYDATHDALTGVFNRSVFEKLRSRCVERDNAMLIIDLDRFKEINDRYGHDAGDRALCYVAALLQEHFRAEDYICRIGGDEFAVIMVRANSSMRHQVEEKFHLINQSLKEGKDGLPPITLSVGVAFGDRENPGEDIFKDADTALYRTKSARLGGCEFY